MYLVACSSKSWDSHLPFNILGTIAASVCSEFESVNLDCGAIYSCTELSQDICDPVYFLQR
jgi:hypothetical protein